MVMIDERRWVDDVYYYIRWRLKLKGETENMGVGGAALESVE